MRKVKIAQIGTSQCSHGNQIFRTLKNLDDVFEIVGYAFPENEREKFPNLMKEFEGYKELTLDEVLNNPEIEAVIVETEEVYLTKYANMVADSKKHIHMEKPGSPDIADFERLIQKVKANRTIDNSKVLKATGLNAEDFLSMKEGLIIEIGKVLEELQFKK